jgi:hypothetical protein
MKSFRQLYRESVKKSIVFTFGRFQPPTIGHELLLDKVAAVAKESGSVYRIYASHSVDPVKNPLQYKDKINFMRKMFPKHGRGIVSSDAKTVLEVMANLTSEGFTDATLVVGSDRVPEFTKLLTKYNGFKSGHGEYKFDTIKVVSAGDRDPDADGVEGMSASKMREAVKNNDYPAFVQGLPSHFVNQGKSLFLALKGAMNIREAVVSLSVDEIRQKYIAGTIFKIGESVALKSAPTTKVTITERHANHVTCSDKKKYFVKDLIVNQ